MTFFRTTSTGPSCHAASAGAWAGVRAAGVAYGITGAGTAKGIGAPCGNVPGTTVGGGCVTIQIRSSDAAGRGFIPRSQRRPLIARLEDGHERFLRNVNTADALHALFAFLLLFEQLALARDVAAVALGRHVLTHRLDRFPRDD